MREGEAKLRERGDRLEGDNAALKRSANPNQPSQWSSF